MVQALFLRHFETKIDPNVPLDSWSLSETGKADEAAFIDESGIVTLADRVFTSPEPKAAETAEEVAGLAGVECVHLDGLREVDRREEGFVESNRRYVEMVETYLSDEQFSFKWEDREDFDRRVHSALAAMAENSEDNETVLIVTHGMWMSRTLARYVGENPLEFWHNLDFGEVVEVELSEILN